MRNKIVKNVAFLFAKIYWAYLKPEIDVYVLNTQKDKFLYFGTDIIFKGSGTLFHVENISIADHVHIGENYFLMGIGGIEIGEGTILSRNVVLHSGNHDFKKGDFIPYNSNYIRKKITIGKGVWIGQNVNVLPGVSIGDGAIIGMGTTVAKDVAPFEIIVGQSQRSLGLRDDVDNLEKLVENKRFVTIENPFI